MKTTNTVLACIALICTISGQAQTTKSPKSRGGAGKKSGQFATVWEGTFDNKATRLAVSSSNGDIILGTDDNSASALDKDGKPIWSGDYKKMTTNKTNKSE